MKRILLLVALASMLAAAMASRGSPRPVADRADAQCAKLAIRTPGPGYNPSKYSLIGGTAGNDGFLGQATDGPDVICGFGGDDRIGATSGEGVDEGDIFLGGTGFDFVLANFGTFVQQTSIRRVTRGRSCSPDPPSCGKISS